MFSFSNSEAAKPTLRLNNTTQLQHTSQQVCCQSAHFQILMCKLWALQGFPTTRALTLKMLLIRLGQLQWKRYWENTCGCFCKAPAAFQHKEYIRKRETRESNSSILSPKCSSCIGDTSPRSLALSLECCSAGAGDTLQRFSTLAIPCRQEGCICEAGVFEQFTHVTAPAPTCKSWGPFPSDLGLLLSGSSLNPPQTWGKKPNQGHSGGSFNSTC